MAEAFIARTESGYKPAYLTICISAGNRAGKTLALAICVLHSVVYKMGLPPPDLTSKGAMQRWLRAPYHWWHFGILTEVADLVWTEMAQLLQGIHEAQRGRAASARCSRRGVPTSSSGTRRRTRRVPLVQGRRPSSAAARSTSGPRASGAIGHWAAT